jgi:electron transport complex protein RnfB
VEHNDRIYVKLQRHLDKQPVGFPATRSGAEINILKHIFTPEEAEIALGLTYKPEPLTTVLDRVRHLIGTPFELKKRLDELKKKGGAEAKIKNGVEHYSLVPLVVGMYEYQVGRLTPEFVADFERYSASIRFGIEFLSTKLPQMRTIPVAKSIQPRHEVSTFDEAATLVQQADAPFVILECICRKKKALAGQACRMTERKETCLVMADPARTFLEMGHGREITRDEALAIIELNQEQGLVLQPSNTAQTDFICSCCGCCCGMLAVHQSLPKPLEFWASNFHAIVDRQACAGCGVCEQTCQVGAVRVSEKTQSAVVDLDRCLGCGACVARCPTAAVTLVKKPCEVRPPRTREDLYDIIMADKKTSWEKLKLTGKLVVDAVRAGQVRLLLP